MVRPREGHDLHIESSVLVITPAHTIRWMRDVTATALAKVDFSKQATASNSNSELVLEQYDTNPLDFIPRGVRRPYPFVYEPDSLTELAPTWPYFTHATRCICVNGRRSSGNRANAWRPSRSLQNVNRHIFEAFKYTRRDEPGVQTPAETLKKGSGSCRDFAALLLEACRAWAPGRTLRQRLHAVRINRGWRRIDPCLDRSLPSRRGLEGF